MDVGQICCLVLVCKLENGGKGREYTNTLKKRTACSISVLNMGCLICKSICFLLLSSPGFLSPSFKVYACADPEWVVLSCCHFQKDTRKAESSCGSYSSLNTKYSLDHCVFRGCQQAFCSGGNMEMLMWCAGARMLWNILSQDFNKPYYNNESSKPACAAAGCESWVLQLVTMSGCWKSLRWLLCSAIIFETWETIICRQLWVAVSNNLYTAKFLVSSLSKRAVWREEGNCV